ncbi:Transposase and inactivated derivatives [Serratia fonticola]|nr:Transposase and inactivated derivatives [Serratia fonticola]
MKTVLIDNQKAAVLKNNNGKVVFNSGFLLLADHYDFLPRACRPRRARTKGKVERMVKYLKDTDFRLNSSSRYFSATSCLNFNENFAMRPHFPILCLTFGAHYIE